ncbi:hypothetical protein [Schleiferilactobacillus harbinensis]|uniref:hypothetical protein n=1 Tax=Schleiferilactobacillus harbinensis TaxID=304207 RepID=UPI0039E8A0E3
MAEAETYKQVFVTYPVQQQDGNFYHIDYVPQYVPVEYPKTVDPIPDELKDKIPKYSWQTHEWIDSGIDPNTAAITALQSNAAVLMIQLMTIKTTLAALQKQVATLTNPTANSTTTTTTKEA